MTENEVAKLYATYGYVVFRRCVVYLGEPSGAQDAVLEVFVRALRSAAAFGADADPRAWLCRIADDVCIDLVRRARRNRMQLETTDEVAGQPAQSAIELAVANDDRAALLSVRRLGLERDPDSFRLAVLYFLDELTQEELAQELGSSRRAIGKRLQQLLQRARSLLEAESVS
jgi:RNA polymerase sigma-70 factor (ECF subfamily)